MTFEEMLEANKKEYIEAQEFLADSKLIQRESSPAYASTSYKLVYSPIPSRVAELTARHGALIADGGNLCFGGRGFSMSVQKGSDTLTFTGTYYTD